MLLSVIRFRVLRVTFVPSLACYLGKNSEQQLWLEISPLFIKVNLTLYKFGIPADLGTLTVLINGFFWFQFATICG